MIIDPHTVDTFEAHIRAMMTPDPEGDIVQWLEANVREVPGSPQPGPFRVESTPFLAPILRALTDRLVEARSIELQPSMKNVTRCWAIQK